MNSSAVVNGANVTIDSHSVSIAGSQRSMVDNIVFTFSEPVTLGSGAFSIAYTAGASVTGTADSSFDSPLPTLSWSNPSSDGETWVVTFSGSSVVGNSVADGVYNITVNAGQVTANAQNMAGSVTNTFYRLFDSTTGDNRVASRPDFSAIQSAEGRTIGAAGYVAYLDYNGDGSIASRPDFSNAQIREGAGFTGFTATI